MYPIIILSRNVAREIDHRAIDEYGMPGIVLMENAGRGVVDFLCLQKPLTNVLICCGKGNNAGDGFVIARLLNNLDIPVEVIMFSNPNELPPDAKINYQIIQKSGLIISDSKNAAEKLAQASWIVDALLGTGLAGIVREPFDEAIAAINKAQKNVLAVDIPSGLDCDSGEALGIAVKATHTLSFVGTKKGFLNQNAKQYIGQLKIIDIGIPKQLINQYRS